MIDPAEGHPIGALDAVGAEAILFEGPVDPAHERRIAVYAEDPSPLRLVAEGLTTEDVREGYWIGRVADGLERLEAVLHVGVAARSELGVSEGARVVLRLVSQCHSVSNNCASTRGSA